MTTNLHFLFRPKTKFWYEKHRLLCMRRRLQRALIFLSTSTWSWSPSASTCGHLILTPPHPSSGCHKWMALRCFTVTAYLNKFCVSRCTALNYLGWHLQLFISMMKWVMSVWELQADLYWSIDWVGVKLRL